MLNPASNEFRPTYSGILQNVENPYSQAQAFNTQTTSLSGTIYAEEYIPQAAQQDYTDTAQKIFYWRLGTYNLLCPQFEGLHNEKGSSDIGYMQDSTSGEIIPNTEFRSDIIFKNISEANLDIYCLQEVANDLFAYLSSALSPLGYLGVYAPHPDNTIFWGSQMPVSQQGVAIFYKQHTFALLSISTGVFKFHQTYRDSASPQNTVSLKQRVHLKADLQEIGSQNIFRVVSCHLFDPRFFTNKADQILQVETLIRETCEDALNRLPYHVDHVIIAGDMNQDQYGDADQDQSGEFLYPDLSRATIFAPFWREGFYMDGSYIPSEYQRKVLGDFNSSIISTKRKVDHIFIKSRSNASSCISLTPYSFQEFDRRGSNHRLVAEEIGIRIVPADLGQDNVYYSIAHGNTPY